MPKGCFTYIYITNEWKWYGKQNYFHNEYRLEGDEVVKFKCNRYKVFDGHENEWRETETRVSSWKLDDPAMLEWLRKVI